MDQGIIRPANCDELLQAAEYYHQKGQTQRQIHFLELALMLNPTDEELLLRIAQTYESIGGKDAGRYYCQLGDIATAPQTAIKYYERAITYAPRDFEPREKIVELVEYLDNEKREIYHARILAKLYLEKGLHEKAITLCNSYLERYPNDLDFYHTLINVYLAQGAKEQAVCEYEKLANVLEQSGNIKLAIENLEKILEIDSEQEEVRKQIKRLQRTMTWKGKRHFILIAAGVAALMICIGIYGLFYNIQARRKYNSALKLIQGRKFPDYKQARKEFAEIIEKYPLSSASKDAELQISKIKNRGKNRKKTDKNKIRIRAKGISQKIKKIQMYARNKKFYKAKKLLLECQKALAKQKNSRLTKKWETRLNDMEMLIQRLEAEKGSASNPLWDLYKEEREKYELKKDKRNFEKVASILKKIAADPNQRKQAHRILKILIVQSFRAVLENTKALLEKARKNLRKRNLDEAKNNYNLLLNKVKEISSSSLHEEYVSSDHWDNLYSIKKKAQYDIEKINTWEQKNCGSLGYYI